METQKQVLTKPKLQFESNLPKKHVGILGTV